MEFPRVLLVIIIINTTGGFGVIVVPLILESEGRHSASYFLGEGK